MPPPLYFPSVSDRWFGEVGWGFCFLFAKVSNFIQKAIVFGGIGVTSFANTFVTICFTERYTEASPDPSERRGGKFASILQKLSEKESKVLILFCAHRHSSPFGEAGWGSSSPRGEECRSRDCPKKFQKLVLVCLEISVLSVKD